jgi:L-amino acid N-acyltransferase YncA
LGTGTSAAHFGYSRDVLKIRRAVESDLPGIFAIYDDEVLHGTASFDEEPYSSERRHAWLLEHASEQHPVLVADDGAELLAWGSLAPWSDQSACARAAEVAVYVHKHCRREGLGRTMLQELITHARAVELGVLLSRVASDSQNSLELQAEFGFRHVGTLRRVAKKFGRLLDVELFELELGVS